MANSSTQILQRRATNHVCLAEHQLFVGKELPVHSSPPKNTLRALLKLLFFLSRQLPLLSQRNNVFSNIWGCLCRMANWKEKCPSNSFYIKIWFAVLKDTKKTCSAVAEKGSMLWITPCPTWITSPAVVRLKWATTECVSQEAECHFHSNLSVWMRI